MSFFFFFFQNDPKNLGKSEKPKDKISVAVMSENTDQQEWITTLGKFSFCFRPKSDRRICRSNIK